MAGPVYIALEGAEGCGKSTHAQLLGDALGALVTRETGGTAIGRRVRAILHDTNVTTLDDHAETLLVAADRAQHMAEVVRPALASGRSVVSDRSVYSTLAYQGYGRGLVLDDVRRINEWAIGETWPDLVLLLVVPAAVSEERMRRRQLDRFEQAGAEFHRRVDDGFAAMAAADPQRWVVVDASQTKSNVATAIRDGVRERLGI
jgi:dTMP kinase